MNATSQSRLARALSQITILVTLVTKLGGVVIALNEIILRSNLRPAVLAEAGFMMAGAQFSESAILAGLDRIMGRSMEPPHPPPAPPAAAPPTATTPPPNS